MDCQVTATKIIVITGYESVKERVRETGGCWITRRCHRSGARSTLSPSPLLSFAYLPRLVRGYGCQRYSAPIVFVRAVYFSFAPSWYTVRQEHRRNVSFMKCAVLWHCVSLNINDCAQEIQSVTHIELLSPAKIYKHILRRRADKLML